MRRRICRFTRLLIGQSFQSRGQEDVKTNQATIVISDTVVASPAISSLWFNPFSAV